MLTKEEYALVKIMAEDCLIHAKRELFENTTNGCKSNDMLQIENTITRYKSIIAKCDESINKV